MPNSILERIEALLDEKVRPSMEAHSGGVSVVNFEDGVLKLKFNGQCSGCPSADTTMENLVSEEVKAAFPQVKELVLVTGAGEDIMNEAWSILSQRRLEREGGA